jgi:uncharacterized protein YndB with AHSA1/START domain
VSRWRSSTLRETLLVVAGVPVTWRVCHARKQEFTHAAGTVPGMFGGPDQITVERFIPAPAEAIFDLLADPASHVDIDGSGTVQEARSGRRRLALGDSFGMDMQLGVSYSTRNVVVEFEENRLIAWQTLAAMPLSLVMTGRTWRYELEPVDGGTVVRETWDISTERWPSRPAVRRMAGSTKTNMERTLERMEELLART